jgi:XrtJ-associated TM-motif-TM protein
VQDALEETMNLKKSLLIFGFPLLLAATMPLYAQTGCDDSPEDPTIVLALVGAAGALVAGARAAKRDQDHVAADRE